MTGYLPIVGALATVMASVAPEAKAIVSLLEARYGAARTLQATFLESYKEDGRLVRMESGTVYFRRPGKMRWEYESPERNVFVVDGKNAWFYVPADHTVTRAPAKESRDWRTPLALLAGEMKLSRICNRVGYASQEPLESAADVMLYCELRGGGAKSSGGLDSGSKQTSPESRESVYLEVAQDSGDLVRILVNDSGNVGIEFHFANWISDPHVDDAIFRFRVPPGVAIVNADLAAAQNTVNR